MPSSTAVGLNEIHILYVIQNYAYKLVLFWGSIQRGIMHIFIIRLTVVVHGKVHLTTCTLPL